ncbi:trehalose-phosphatase [Winslowiella iniecta]|uniref:Trehalose 6-phosphate phosphatase n=1 Tax=Winslowiella iniecta TaxID=1560201 RepID=A0A0L7T5W1_9GAMM|nr:trehalose-phosphatase [Winslowiella iniecta]KOC88793.1 trehalose phosphatase [Winslowiella iniecta]KOC90745.1 trehalose phosphatase [Winslowiella iniecta]
MTRESEGFPSLSGGLYAFFFDVDGTLAAIKPRPDEVSIPASVRRTLQSLSALSHGAVALISGRPVEQLDGLAAPFHAPLAGVHGAERRDATGELHRISLPDEVVKQLHETLSSNINNWPGTQLETKGMAFALHYRQAEHYQPQILQLAESMVKRFPMLALQPGKCVVELKPKGIDKGAAIRAFMQEAPFAGRIPLFIGDDLTDEAGFRVVNAMNGLSVKVGEGSSDARFRLKDVDEVYSWLEQMKLQLDQDNLGKESRL